MPSVKKDVQFDIGDRKPLFLIRYCEKLVARKTPLTFVILTYMSIQDWIRYLEAEGRLVRLAHAMEGMPCPRALFLLPEIYEPVIGSDYRMGKLRADLDHFTEGGLIIVGQRTTRYAHMKRLDPGEKEAWEIRSRDPLPELRLFGRFALPDVFVGTRLCDRDYLGIENSREWRDEINRCGADWRNLFPAHDPVCNGALNDYISTNVHDAGRFE